MGEWFNLVAWNAAVREYRGFESPSVRHYTISHHLKSSL
ncbi:hypothetical protein BN3087_660027 [Sulfurovum sp. enrichment culture clone C5]|uniref:Uncharacterized protein n=1 Tax=Sulfurovum sp. enrichment culture clone C5 TaxID=497650 RepID=A0A0S4XQI9_9BACT|nr:hypothetical protein BN3087_660027 [Sulfurovum sp. enrichment culture clone C5]